MSPSRMPASIIESPRTSSAKCSPPASKSGGIAIVWLRFWIASIGVPAAMRPITGTSTGSAAVVASAAPGAPTRPQLALDRRSGVKPRARSRHAVRHRFGQRITSSARARFGRRRMKPRSSSAVIRRWMPDFERRSSASFISSKEGGMPGFLQPLMDEPKQFVLACASASARPSLGRPRQLKQIMNGHYPFHVCSARWVAGLMMRRAERRRSIASA